MLTSTARQQEALAHIGGALLSAQLVEHFVVLFLCPSDIDGADVAALNAFLAGSKLKRHKRMRGALAKLSGHKSKLTQLERDLNRFLKDRNKLVHSFPDLGVWNFTKARDCHACVSFLRDFIDRAAVLQHEFVSLLSMRDAQFKTRVSELQSKVYARNFKRVHGPLNVRWFERLDA
jgi:hypothetical protein